MVHLKIQTEKVLKKTQQPSGLTDIAYGIPLKEVK